MWVVDFDGPATNTGEGPIVGPVVVAAAKAKETSPGPHISYLIKPASDFNNDPMRVRDAIYHDKAFSAIVINPNASALLRQAVRAGNSSYDPNGACQTIYVEARDQIAVDSYMVPELQSFQAQVVAIFAQTWVPEAMNMTSDLSTIPPQAISPALGFTTINLRRFGPTQATPAVTVGLIYLIIIAFFSYTFFLPTHTHFVAQCSPGSVNYHRKLYFGHLISWKYTSTLTAYFFMSLSYSLVSLAFQIPFSSPPYSHVEPVPPGMAANGYGHASFVVYWAVNFLGMSALGFACENVAMVVGQPFTAIWLIFWVISNVCTAFYPLQLSSGVYKYGLFFPLYNVVKATRIILFDTTKQHMGRHVGILVAWWCVNTVLFPIAARIFRHNTCRRVMLAQKKAEQEKEKIDLEKEGERLATAEEAQGGVGEGIGRR